MNSFFVYTSRSWMQKISFKYLNGIIGNMSRKFIFETIIPSVVFSHKTVSSIFGGVYNILGENGADALLYNVGYKTGKFYTERQRDTSRVEKMELLYKCISDDFEAKWGKFEYNIDFDTLGGEVKIYNSFLADSWIENIKKNQSYPVCAFISGYIVGILESVFGKKVFVEEKKCKVQGNEFCLFEVKKSFLR